MPDSRSSSGSPLATSSATAKWSSVPPDNRRLASCERNFFGVGKCGKPAEYMIFGDPCCCVVSYGKDECCGHSTCEDCVAELRLKAVLVDRRREETFRVTRVHSLQVAS